MDTLIWNKKSQEEIKKTVFDALDKNVNYQTENIIGVPASYLDSRVFSQDVSFLKDAPFITALVNNPNHIGCHTMGTSEHFFSGTHAIEKELIEICSVDILKGNQNEHDGYVASGGTEANIQAMWIYRNFFIEENDANLNEIAIICSEDSHYSVDKASNLLCIDIIKIPVEKSTRKIDKAALENLVQEQKQEGKKYFIVFANMMTTMFGSVDCIKDYIHILKKYNLNYKVHIDGAYGGFYHPFSRIDSGLGFDNPEITSFTLDAHKMAQAPYGTGIFLIKKGFMKYANTNSASYVEGEDSTLIGSRSGANAIGAWMILVKNGPHGWMEKIFILQKRTEWLCDKLNDLNIEYYRHPSSNIVTIASNFVTDEIAKKYGLVPDNHQSPNWFKVVIMEHVTIEKLIPLVNDLKTEN